MAGKWEGFSEDDINNVLRTAQDTHVQKPSVKVAALQKKNLVRERILHSLKQSQHEKIPVDIPPEARLAVDDNDDLPLMALTINSDSSEANTPTKTPSANGPVCIKIKEDNGYEVIETNQMNCSSDTLKMMIERQKMLEEQNRKRKELLAKALADRKKRTTAEAKRLQLIQEELQKLDLSLSNDVNILRNQIETASLTFMEAQKRFDKAEKEFLDAKLTLFTCLEKKELLTQHLCTIIEQNEMRKAQKLSELMDKLEVGEPNDSVILSPCTDSALSEKNKEVEKSLAFQNKGFISTSSLNSNINTNDV